MNLKKLFNDEAGVSPIVATLVLVVVAIAGAAAVGTIMGSFSSDVSDSASAEGASASASTSLLIDGSSTVYPVSVLLAEEFMKENPGIKVDVTSSGSGTGVAATGMDLVDIGAASRAVKASELETYPDIQTHTIGGSGVVMVLNSATVDASNISSAEAAEVYSLADSNGEVALTNDGTTNEILAAAGTGFTVVKRVGDSGTQDTFADHIELTDPTFDDKYMESDSCTAIEKDGNTMVAEYIKSTPDTIAFVDYGFAKAYGLDIVEIDRLDGTADDDAVVDAINGDGAEFPTTLTRPLNYLTYGAPSSVEQAFIDFATMPKNSDIYEDNGYFALVDL